MDFGAVGYVTLYLLFCRTCVAAVLQSAAFDAYARQAARFGVPAQQLFPEHRVQGTQQSDMVRALPSLQFRFRHKPTPILWY